MKATSEELAIFVAVVESGSFSRAAASAGRQSSLDRPIPLSAGQLKSWR
ncbi:LysR family transcripitonal regulator [Salmonella enterica]|uniref:LysR family transcripitonal regulator n=1 Tax=Salmonella enterica TaxID=28901 RepID=A0A7D8IYF6_SALER|nr:LysR family transcripitonal regulator [Salmonella enterica]